ncbi:hypothetical protein RMATCC62417_16989 [Rhizopus microsporus]|nr:hypothetical protein RMATCC62417_16989 [Rhizopus microsporus]
MNEWLDSEELRSVQALLHLKETNLTTFVKKKLLEQFSVVQSSTRELRRKLKQCDAPDDLDVVLHANVSSLEATIRYFLDLIESPRNYMLFKQSERPSAVQLFLPYNDIAEFDWMENEYCLTEKRKWHGVLFLVDDHLITTALVEFLGGLKKVSRTEELSDIEKLYENMLKLLENILNQSKSELFVLDFMTSISTSNS